VAEVAALQWVEVAVRPDHVLPSVLPQEVEAAELLPQCPDPDQEQVLFAMKVWPFAVMLWAIRLVCPAITCRVPLT